MGEEEREEERGATRRQESGLEDVGERGSEVSIERGRRGENEDE